MMDSEKPQDLVDLEKKIVRHLGQKQTKCDVSLIPPAESQESEEQIRIHVEYGEQITVQNMAKRRWLEDVRPRASLIEAIEKRIHDVSRRLRDAQTH